MSVLSNCWEVGSWHINHAYVEDLGEDPCDITNRINTLFILYKLVCVCVWAPVQRVGRSDPEKVPTGVLTLTTGHRHWSVAQHRPLIGQDTSGQREPGSDWSGHRWSEVCFLLIGQDTSGQGVGSAGLAYWKDACVHTVRFHNWWIYCKISALRRVLLFKFGPIQLMANFSSGSEEAAAVRVYAADW